MTKNASKDDRKSQIVAVARSLLAKDGEAGFSLREVAKQVGIKLASLQYHFPTKSALIEAILENTIDNYVAELHSLPSLTDGNHKEVLISALDWLTGADRIEDDEVRLEIHLWSLALNNQSVAQSMSEYHKKYVEKIAELITNASQEITMVEAQKRAIAIASMQEGSMLFMNHNIGELSQKQILQQIHQACVRIALC